MTYGDARNACDHEGPYVHPWCDGDKGPVTCGNEEETRKPKREIEQAKNRIADLKEKGSKADSNRSNAKTEDEKKKYEDEITQIDKDLYEAGKTLEAAEKSLETRKKLVEDAIYTLDKCISYRKAVLNSFATALDRMRNENETDELKTVARSLASKYEKAKSGHEEQVSSRTNAWNSCKGWRP